MREIIGTFPFTYTDEMVDSTGHDALRARAQCTIAEYMERDDTVIAAMVADEELNEDMYAMCYGMTFDAGKAWEGAGFQPKNKLGRELLVFAIYWTGIAARRAFIAGVSLGRKQQQIEGLLEDINLSDLGGDDDMG